MEFQTDKSLRLFLCSFVDLLVDGSQVSMVRPLRDAAQGALTASSMLGDMQVCVPPRSLLALNP